jgi:acyl-CoA synthetase (AMP-forming)/AMP-acid ligase II
MAMESINPRTGFCQQTKTFHSLRPPTPFPPPHQPLSITHFILSLLQSSTVPTTTTTYLTIPSTGESITYSQAIDQIHSLSSSLKNHYSLNNKDVAFILCPPSLHVPVLYLSLMYLGVIISPANPLSSDSELAHQFQLCKPKIAFATSQTAHKLPSLPLGTILIDSPEFTSLLTQPKPQAKQPRVEVSQSDIAAILYSSGTTGRVKGVALTHRNLIALISGFHHNMKEPEPNQPEQPPVSLFILPLFHVFGFFMSINAFSRGETLVLMERFDFVQMLKHVEKYRVTYMPVSPPLIVAFVKSDLTEKYDLSSLRSLGCGGAPLGKEVADKFKEKFPHVEIVQVIPF